MKNTYLNIILVFTILVTITSCNEGRSKHEAKENECKSISYPSENRVKNDLIGQKIGTWKFDKIEEIISIKTSNHLETEGGLFFDANMDMEDYITGNRFKGELNFMYTRTNNEYFFKSVSGNIYEQTY